MLLLIDADDGALPLLLDDDEPLPLLLLDDDGIAPPRLISPLPLLDDDGTIVPPLLRFGLDLRVLVISISSVGRGILPARRRRSCSASAAAAAIAIAEAIVIPAIPPGSKPGLIGVGGLSGGT